jgi:flagellar assembly protein FliH
VRAGAATVWRPEDLSGPPAPDVPVAQPQPQAETQGAPPAEEDASALLAEIERMRAAAREAGYREGLEQGRLAAAEDVAALRALLGRLGELVGDIEQGIASDVLSLSLDIAKHVVRSSLRVKPDLVLAVIRDAIASFPELAEGARLVLHPADAELVRAAAGTADSELAVWTIVEDPQIERGGCRLQTGATEIDATLENRWRRMVAALGRDDAWLDIDL